MVCLIWGMLPLVPGAVSATCAGAAGALSAAASPVSLRDGHKYPRAVRSHQ